MDKIKELDKDIVYNPKSLSTKINEIIRVVNDLSEALRPVMLTIAEHQDKKVKHEKS